MHQKSSVGSNLRLLKSVGAVGWQPTGFEDVSIAIKRAVLGPTCAYLSLYGLQVGIPTGFEDVSIGI